MRWGVEEVGEGERGGVWGGRVEKVGLGGVGKGW